MTEIFRLKSEISEAHTAKDGEVSLTYFAGKKISLRRLETTERKILWLIGCLLA